MTINLANPNNSPFKSYMQYILVIKHYKSKGFNLGSLFKNYEIKLKSSMLLYI